MDFIPKDYAILIRNCKNKELVEETAKLVEKVNDKNLPVKERQELLRQINGKFIEMIDVCDKRNDELDRLMKVSEELKLESKAFQKRESSNPIISLGFVALGLCILYFLK